jgi:hypothetical protein
MIRKIKNIILAAVLPLALAAPLAVPVATYAVGGCDGINGSINEGVNAAVSGSSGDCDTPASNGPDGGLAGIAKKIVNLLSVIVGIVAVIMIIVGGFRYITSGGESSNVSGAKNTLIYAIVGLIIVALAQFIVHFVLDNIG